MRSFQLLLVLFVIGVGTIFAATTASADTTMFADNFDSEGQNANPSPYSANYNWWQNFGPTGGSPGTWTLSEPGPDRIQVTSSTTSPDPGAYQGANCLRILRDGAEPMATMNFTAQDVGQTYSWKGEVYIPAQWSGNPFQVLGNGGSLFNVMTNYDGAHNNTIWSYTNSGWPPASRDLTSVAFTAGAWQQWQIDYTQGTANLTLTVDGNSATVPINASGTLSLSTISIVSDMSCYVDTVSVTNVTAVPEPSTVIMLTSGLVGLLAYAWRKRR